MLKVKSVKETLNYNEIANLVHKHEMVLQKYRHLKDMYDNKNDIKQQTKIEQKILELLNSRSFRIANTNYLSRNEIPVYSLPNFLVIKILFAS